MKRIVFAATALLLGGCASAGGTATPAGTVRTTTPVQMGTGRSVIVASHADAAGVTHVLRIPTDRVWEALPAVYGSLGIPVGTSVPATRTLGNQSYTVSRTIAGGPVSRVVSCGDGPTGAPIADTHRVTFSILTVLEPAEDATTRVRNTVSARASNPSVSGAPVTCATTGTLETRIVEKIRELTGS